MTSRRGGWNGKGNNYIAVFNLYEMFFYLSKRHKAN